MSKVLLLVHRQFTEFFLTSLLRTIPDTQVVTLPYTVAAQYSLENTLEQLQKLLLTHSTEAEQQIDVVIVEANYGVPAATEANVNLIENLLEQFNEAVIIAYSGTTAALAKALQINSRVMVMDNNNKFEEDVLNLCALLKDTNSNSAISSRVLTTKLLKEFVGPASDSMRKRSLTLPQMPTRSPSIESRNRRNTSPEITPMYTAALRDKTDSVNQEQPENVNKRVYSKMDI